MKSNKCIICYTMATLLYFLLCLITASTEICLEQAIEQQLNKGQLQHQTSDDFASDQNVIQHLNRKKRYLEFPEGSSFQLGVVDYTNYLILGVTVALAWELPSKPPSEIFEDFTERLRDGTLGTSRNDTVENIKYMDSKTRTAAIKIPGHIYQYKLQPIFQPPMHYRYYKHRSPDSFYKHRNNKKSQNLKYNNNPNIYHSRSRKGNSNYTPKQPHPFTNWVQTKNQHKYTIKDTKYPWWNLPERLKNSFITHTRPIVRRLDQNKNYAGAQSSSKTPFKTYKTFSGTERSEHRIYRVFGKRSIYDEEIQSKNCTSNNPRFRRSGIAGEQLSKLDRIHIEHHRKTRRDLYQRIEVYLNGRGSHGHHCVLRALCETGQKSHERKPGSFVGELMRVIFTMPEPSYVTTDSRKQIGYKEQRYDKANALKEVCGIRYNLCKDSLWSSHFVF